MGARRPALPVLAGSAGTPAPARPRGPDITSTYLSIGGISLEISSDEAGLVRPIAGPLLQFVTAPAPPDVQLRVTSAEALSVPNGRLLFDSGAVWRLHEADDGVEIALQTPALGSTPYAIAAFDRDFTRGTVRVRTDAAAGPIDPIEYPLDQLLFSNLLGRGRGVELHSCGIIDADGRGHLFVGESGSGKTTTAGLWGDGVVVLSDDRVIVRVIDGEYRMFGTPWHGEGRLCSSGSVRLDGVYLLRQSPETELKELDAAERVARLFSCTFALFHDAEAMSFTIGFLDRLAAAVPVRELRFLPDRSAVDAVLATSQG